MNGVHSEYGFLYLKNYLSEDFIMKLYCFYLYDKKMTKERYKQLISAGAKIDDIYPLYALTNNKQFMKMFIKQRDMSKFILITKDVDKEMGIAFMNTHHSPVLQNNLYDYYPKIGRNISKSKKIPIISTFEEEAYVKTSCEEMCFLIQELPFKNENEHRHRMELRDFPVPYILKREFIEALETLEYINFFKLNIGPTATEQNEDSFGWNDFPSIPDIIFDEFRIFVYEFGEYFK